jgi:hypothetical protein
MQKANRTLLTLPVQIRQYATKLSALPITPHIAIVIISISLCRLLLLKFEPAIVNLMKGSSSVKV